MKNRKENYMTKSDLKSALKVTEKKLETVIFSSVEKSEKKLVGMMGTMEDRIMGNMAEAIGQSEKKMMSAIAGVDVRVTETQVLLIDTRSVVDKIVGNLIMLEKVITDSEKRVIKIVSDKIDKLDERFVTRREFLSA